MAAQKVAISGFLNFFAPHGVITNEKAPAVPPANQFGYVLGADGRVATEAYIIARSKSSYPATWKSYAARCKKWIGRRVWDCNSMPEGYYFEQTGVSINTKARSNYALWCDPKSPVKADKKLTGIPQLPGVAVFSGATATTIGHVGYLLYKYGPGLLDWYVIEARGADYGVVITKLMEREWAWWGVMEKYFLYDVDAKWKPGDVPNPIESYFATCGGNDVNVRTGRSTSTPSIGKISLGEKILALPPVDGWCEAAVQIEGVLTVGYIYAQYVIKQ